MADIMLFGTKNCHKTQYYEMLLKERGLSYQLAEVDQNPDAAARLSELTGSPDKFPAFLIKGKKLRNPSLKALDKALARAGLYDAGLIHDAKTQRYIRYMAPSDAFVSYIWQGKRMVLTHIEVASSLRGSGIGARFAMEVFKAIENQPYEIRLTCPFLQKTALTRSEWRQKFNL